jgi:hypothetical protein
VLDEHDGFMRSKSEERVLDGRYNDFQSGDDFGEFKLPDLSVCLTIIIVPTSTEHTFPTEWSGFGPRSLFHG